MIRIITDSTSSLPKDLREKLGIHLLNLVVNRGGVSHVEGEMDLDAFYADIYEMADDIPTSSQPSALSIEAALEEAGAAGGGGRGATQQAMKCSESSSAAGCQARLRGLRARREKLPSVIPISSMRSSTA